MSVRITSTLAAAAVAATLLAGLSGCASKPAPDPYQLGPVPSAAQVAKAELPGQWKKEDDEVDFTGVAGPGSAKAFATAVGNGGGLKKLVVTSPGGDLGDGLRIADFIRAHKLDIVVNGVCAGPCADYWFTAAAHRTVKPGGWLGFVPDLTSQYPAQPQYDAQRKDEAALYQAAGVHADVLRTTLQDQLRLGAAADQPHGSVWMPTKAELSSLGYGGFHEVWLPPNLASANAQAQPWSIIAAYHDTLVGYPLPTPTPTGSHTASKAPAAKH